MARCKHDSVQVTTLEEVHQEYNIDHRGPEHDYWEGGSDFGKIHKVIQAICSECKEDLSAKVARRLGVPSQ